MKKYLAVQPDGNYEDVPGTYAGIKKGLGGATLDFVKVSPNIGFYVDDEGMLNGSALNVPASMVARRPLWGPAVLVRGEPDPEGNSLPAEEKFVASLRGLAIIWMMVVGYGRQLGQDVIPSAANPDTLPPPKFTSLTEEQFNTWLSTGEMPS